MVVHSSGQYALGIKNYLFAGSHTAAQRIAMMYYLFVSCKVNDINPYNWLKHVFDDINDTKNEEPPSIAT